MSHSLSNVFSLNHGYAIIHLHEKHKPQTSLLLKLHSFQKKLCLHCPCLCCNVVRENNLGIYIIVFLCLLNKTDWVLLASFQGVSGELFKEMPVNVTGFGGGAASDSRFLGTSFVRCFPS